MRATPLPELPYRGIQPYRFADHSIFFARNEETHDLLRLVAVYRAVMLYGHSGAGKSSLINAGLLPEADAKGLEPVRVRVQPRDGEELVIERIGVADDGESFLPSLFVAADEPAPRVVLSTEAFEARLRSASASARPLLVFDQFEELVTLFDEDALRTLQRRIADLLVVLLRDEELPVKLLLAFREDYLAAVKHLLATAPELVDQALRLTSPAARELRTIIRGPFERFPGHYERELGAGLADVLAARLTDRFGSGEISLSEVQTVCIRLWQSDEPERLLEQRGVKGLLEDYLGEELDSFPAELAHAAVALLGQMVTPSGTRNVISAESLIERVQSEDEIPTERLQEALERLESRSKLVRRERRRDLYLYEMTSEFLVPWINRRREESMRLRDRQRERRRLLVLGCALVGLVLVVAAVSLLAAWALGQRADADRAAASATSFALASAANAQLGSRPDVALLLALEAYRLDPNAGTNTVLTSALENIRRTGATGLLLTDRALSAAFSPDGRMLATGEIGGKVEFWTTHAPERLGTPLDARTDAVFDLAFSPDGRRLVTSAGYDGRMRLWDVHARRQIGHPLRGHTSYVDDVAFSRDGHTIASSSAEDRAIRLWDARTQGALPRLRGNVDPGEIDISADGHTLAAASGTAVRFWDLRTRRELAPRLRLPAGADAWGVVFSSDGRTLAVSGGDRKVRLWSMTTHEQLGQPFRAELDAAIAFSPNGRLLAASDGRYVGVWDVRTHEQRAEVGPLPNGTTLLGPAYAVNHVAFSPDGHTLAITHRNGSVWLADLRVTGHHGETLGGARGPGRPSPVDAVAYSPDGQTVAGGSKDGTVRLWDARTHRLLGKPLPGHAGPVSAVSFSRDGRTVAVAEPRLVTLWDVRTRRPVGEPLGAWKAKIRSVAFSPDGRTLAVAGAGVHLVDLDTHRELAVLGRRFGAANDVAFSPDGRTLASSTEDGTVRLWSVRRRVPVGQPLRFDPGNVRGLQTLAIAFSPDGRTLAGIREGEGETLLAHWDLATHVELAEVSFARFDPLDVAFSPDGTTLALPGSDGTVRLVDATTHTRLGNPLRGHVGGVNAVAFSADGRTLVTAGDDGTVRLWNGFLVPTGDLAYARRLVCSLVGGRLSRQDWAEFARGIAYPKHQTCP